MASSLFFFISYPRQKRDNIDDIVFIVPNNQNPECIFTEEFYQNQIYFYKKIYKVTKSNEKGKKNNNYYFEFELGDDKYIISFDSKGNTFIYNVVLEM